MIADLEGPSFITRTVGRRRCSDGAFVTHDPTETWTAQDFRSAKTLFAPSLKRGIVRSIGMRTTSGGRDRMAIHIRRREFIFTLGGAAVAWPLAARAQQPKVPTIGALVIGNISPEEFWRGVRQGLRDLGYIEGQNIRFEFRSAEGQIDRLPELAAELVRLKIDIIGTWFTPTAVAAKQATREIPIVMAETGDPIGTGLVMSLPRPGGNVTGIASVTPDLAGKSVQLIRDMLPSPRRVTALANATDPFSKPFLEQIQLGGEATGTAINPIRISNDEDSETALPSMAT